MEEDGQTTPFWTQTTTYFSSTKNRRRSNPLSFCLNSGGLMVLLLIIAMITILFVIPSLLSFTSQVFRPNLVRKSWDNLNLVLVLFAILCGILGRKRDDGIASNAVQVPEEPVQPQWFGYSNKDNETVNLPKGLMKRNSSSYPDLRQESSWAFPDDNWRSFDDNYVYNHRLESNYVHRPRYRQQDSGVKTTPVDTYVVRQQEPLSPPPQSPPARQARRTFQSVAQKEISDIKEMGFTKIQSPPPPPPHSLYTPPAQRARRTFQSVAQKENSEPPPPPPSEPHTNRSDKEVRRSERKKSGGAKDMATTIASLYNSRKRKMKQKSKENFDDIFPSPVYLQPVPTAFPPPPSPPPPPPPPLASKFQQLFKKGNKTKRIRSVSVSSSKQQPPPPPPPPRPPPMSPLRTYKHKTHRERPMTQPPPPPPPPPMSPLHTYKHKTHRQRPMTQPPPPPSEFSRSTEPMTPDRPPLPSKLDSFYNESSSSVNQPPSIPMPPPPPQPPFKVSGFKFVVEGDYVRLQSIQSSRSNSPDLDSTDTPPTSTPPTPASGGTEPVVSVFCPSPDVNTKADTFIARFRAGLRMEKAKSFNEKQVMGNSVPTQTSNLMPK